MSAIATCIMLGAVLGSILTAAIIAVSATMIRRPPGGAMEPEEWGEEIYRPPQATAAQAPAQRAEPRIIAPGATTAPRVITRLTRQQRTTEI
jgi:hypothetical protein